MMRQRRLDDVLCPICRRFRAAARVMERHVEACLARCHQREEAKAAAAAAAAAGAAGGGGGGAAAAVQGATLLAGTGQRGDASVVETEGGDGGEEPEEEEEEQEAGATHAAVSVAPVFQCQGKRARGEGEGAETSGDGGGEGDEASELLLAPVFQRGKRRGRGAYTEEAANEAESRVEDCRSAASAPSDGADASRGGEEQPRRKKTKINVSAMQTMQGALSGGGNGGVRIRYRCGGGSSGQWRECGLQQLQRMSEGGDTTSCGDVVPPAISVVPAFLPEHMLDELSQCLLVESQTWETKSWWVFDKKWTTPRCTDLYHLQYGSTQRDIAVADEGDITRSSGRPTPVVFERVASAVEEWINARLRRFHDLGDAEAVPMDARPTVQRDIWRSSYVFCNLYRNASDCVGAHSDSLTALGPFPIIASLSLGATRRFKLTRMGEGAGKGIENSWTVDIPHGCLLIMWPPTQEYWRHEVTRSTTVRPHRQFGMQRVNLTFRQMKPEVSNLIPNCHCKRKAVLKAVASNSSNLGRHYLGCHPARDSEPCKFFQWADKHPRLTRIVRRRNQPTPKHAGSLPSSSSSSSSSSLPPSASAAFATAATTAATAATSGTSTAPQSTTASQPTFGTARALLLAATATST